MRLASALRAAASRLRNALDGGVVVESTVSARPMRVAAASSARRMCSAWISMVAVATAAVTTGLPSRSPPIQLPIRMKRGAWGARVPVASPASARSSDRISSGRMRNSVSSNTAMNERTSSSGWICVVRICAVRHSESTSSTSLRSDSRRSESAILGSSRRSSCSPARRIAVTIARRLASVGCAVNTGWISILVTRSCNRFGPSLLRSWPTVAAIDSGTGSEPRSRSRITRARWCSSARLARWK